MRPDRNPSLVIPAQAVAAIALCATAGLPLTSVAAALCFPLVEYAAHRWAFHGPAAAIHEAHHRYPSDLSHFTVPVWITVAVSLAAAVVSPAVAGGLLAGMCLYDLAHLACHGRAWFPFRRALAAHHALHHAQPGKNFSVSFPPIDSLLCSRAKKQK